jgi:hypothetical protein
LPGFLGEMPHGVWQAKPVECGSLLPLFKRIPGKLQFGAVFKSGSKLPHSQSALRAQKLCGNKWLRR